MKRQTRRNRYENPISIERLLENALEHTYSHNIGNDVNGWFVPLSGCVVDVGDGSLFDVIGHVIKCIKKFVNDYPMCLLFVFCLEQYGWIVMSMDYSKTYKPTVPCFSLKEGKIDVVNELWKAVFEQSLAQTSGYKA